MESMLELHLSHSSPETSQALGKLLPHLLFHAWVIALAVWWGLSALCLQWLSQTVVRMAAYHPALWP